MGEGQGKRMRAVFEDDSGEPVLVQLDADGKIPVAITSGGDHGALTGLGDDDHTQYLKEKLNGGLASEIPLHDHSSAAEAGQIDHDDLLNVSADQHHAEDHQARHQTGGADALVGDIDANARVNVRVNSGADVGERRRLNLIDGDAISISAVDDAGGEEVDITINATLPFEHARVTHSVDQALAADTDTILAFDTELEDVGGLHVAAPNSRLTAPVDGTYMVGASVRWEGEDNVDTNIRLILNGTTVIAESGSGSREEKKGELGDSVSIGIELSATDYIEVEGYSSEALDVLSIEDLPVFWMVRVQD